MITASKLNRGYEIITRAGRASTYQGDLKQILRIELAQKPKIRQNLSYKENKENMLCS